MAYKTQKINDTEIFGLTLTLEKPTRGKPVREGDIYYLGASENSVTTYSSSEI
jgi:hypothetical protein